MFDITTLEPEHVKLLETLVGDPRGSLWLKPLAVHPGQSISRAETEVYRFAFRPPDMRIAPDGDDYIFRWWLIPRREVGANVYLHLQVADDPERPLHDHPWDNQSVILAGGYREVYVRQPGVVWNEHERVVRQGQTVHRRAEEAHRLFLDKQTPYTISLFSTGPVVRDWGFWFERSQGLISDHFWRPHDEVIEQLPDGRSIFKGEDHV